MASLDDHTEDILPINCKHLIYEFSDSSMFDSYL